MRECAYKASLLTTLNSTHLEFTTEPDAIALYCLNVKGHNLHYGGSGFFYVKKNYNNCFL
ncbi:hypothetical protein RhiirC2_798342 [Rhizophagus irregularis]|uniref:Uncharacterized protein n=1 Tax=Rhizophagus irregularis TaxID=588596 RepID=A0A2N1M6L0_9GLOM|nr:hypothetical protein RhiirC2_798342 [Rhizophagus irregularis]